MGIVESGNWVSLLENRRHRLRDDPLVIHIKSLEGPRTKTYSDAYDDTIVMGYQTLYLSSDLSALSTTLKNSSGQTRRCKESTLSPRNSLRILHCAQVPLGWWSLHPCRTGHPFAVSGSKSRHR